MENKSMFDWMVELYGEEEAKQRMAYIEDIETRKKLGSEVMLRNISGLYDQINSKLGLNLKFFHEFEYDSKGIINFINIESNNFVEDYPILANAWKEFRVSNFGGGFYHDNSHSDPKDYSKLSKNLSYSMSIDYHYTNHCGGFNGECIGTAYADEASGWKWSFTPAKKRSEPK